jgi:hypothetical protein
MTQTKLHRLKSKFYHNSNWVLIINIIKYDDKHFYSQKSDKLLSFHSSDDSVKQFSSQRHWGDNKLLDNSINIGILLKFA